MEVRPLKFFQPLVAKEKCFIYVHVGVQHAQEKLPYQNYLWEPYLVDISYFSDDYKSCHGLNTW